MTHDQLVPVDINESRSVKPDPEEVWLTFTNEESAEDFEQWWKERGHKVFVKWCKKSDYCHIFEE